MKDLLISLIKLLCTVLKYLKNIIIFRTAFLISSLKYENCFDVPPGEEEDIQVEFH